MEFYNNILTDSGNFALVIFGFTATLFTVVFSFIIMERDKLIELSELIKSGQKNPILFEKESKINRRIRGYKKLNKLLLIALITNFVIYCSSVIIKYFVYNEVYKEYASYGIGAIMIVVSVLIICLIVYVIYKYLGATKT